MLFFFDDDDDGQSPGQKFVFYNTGLTTLYMIVPRLVCIGRCFVSKVPVFTFYNNAAIMLYISFRNKIGLF